MEMRPAPGSWAARVLFISEPQGPSVRGSSSRLSHLALPVLELGVQGTEQSLSKGVTGQKRY